MNLPLPPKWLKEAAQIIHGYSLFALGGWCIFAAAGELKQVCLGLTVISLGTLILRNEPPADPSP
jgi:hypothetical protein